MRSVDKAIDDMQERIRKDSEKQEEKIKVKKENSITTDMLSELLGIDIRKEKGLTQDQLADLVQYNQGQLPISKIVVTKLSV